MNARRHTRTHMHARPQARTQAGRHARTHTHTHTRTKLRPAAGRRLLLRSAGEPSPLAPQTDPRGTWRMKPLYKHVPCHQPNLLLIFPSESTAITSRDSGRKAEKLPRASRVGTRSAAHIRVHDRSNLFLWLLSGCLSVCLLKIYVYTLHLSIGMSFSTRL